MIDQPDKLSKYTKHGGTRITVTALNLQHNNLQLKNSQILLFYISLESLLQGWIHWGGGAPPLALARGVQGGLLISISNI